MMRSMWPSTARLWQIIEDSTGEEAADGATEGKMAGRAASNAFPASAVPASIIGFAARGARESSCIVWHACRGGAAITAWVYVARSHGLQHALAGVHAQNGNTRRV